jgi:hypothetical protein
MHCCAVSSHYLATFFAASKHNYDVHIKTDILIKEQECMTSLIDTRQQRENLYWGCKLVYISVKKMGGGGEV